MTHLVQIALGPVQGFIATARRSRDLWYGSYILSELSKAAARSLHGQRGELIFPAPADAAVDLAPKSDLLVANIITALLSGANLERARGALEQARSDVKVRWKELCDTARHELEPKVRSRDNSRCLTLIRREVWDAQLDDVVEFFCAAVPMVGDTTYRQANDDLRRLMAQRKSTRDFSPYKENFHLPKSSLDGARSTVLVEFADKDPVDAFFARMRVGLDPAEQLDTAGMVKRVVGRERGFLPVARVAAEKWLRRAEKEEPALLAQLVRAYDGLPPDGLVTMLEGKYSNTTRHPEYGWVARFPYDAQLLYPERIEAEVGKLKRALRRQEQDPDKDPWDEDPLKKPVDELTKALSALKKKLGGTPQPYYGMLLADGDHMGGLIDKAADHPSGLDMHREVSKALALFAQGVPKLMASKGGACIYSGGDDVFGLVPLHCAIDCAEALSKDFARTMAAVADKLGIEKDQRPSLSVGIALVHMLEPLGDVREIAKRAEALAKGQALAAGKDRNALALIAKPRSGNAYQCRIRWDDAAELQRLRDWTDKIEAEKIPGGLPHELESVWHECEGVFKPVNEPKSDFTQLWRARVSTVLRKKRLENGSQLDEVEVDALLSGLCPKDVAADRSALDAFLLARWLGVHAEEVA